jgi:hypothetical protein
MYDAFGPLINIFVATICASKYTIKIKWLRNQIIVSSAKVSRFQNVLADVLYLAIHLYKKILIFNDCLMSSYRNNKTFKNKHTCNIFHSNEKQAVSFYLPQFPVIFKENIPALSCHSCSLDPENRFSVIAAK